MHYNIIFDIPVTLIATDCQKNANELQTIITTNCQREHFELLQNWLNRPLYDMSMEDDDMMMMMTTPDVEKPWTRTTAWPDHPELMPKPTMRPLPARAPSQCMYC